MTYLRRAVKYFLQICLLFVVIVAALMAFGMVSTDVALAFRNGWTSILYIAGLFAVMSAVYPFFGYGKRTIRASGAPEEHWNGIEKAMAQRGYVQAETLEDGCRRYHLRSPLNRAARFWEDTITITPILGGFEAEGLVRDLGRIVMSIDRNLNDYGN